VIAGSEFVVTSLSPANFTHQQANRKNAMSFKLLIDGKLTDGASTLDVVNPATGKAFASKESLSRLGGPQPR
jgi:hypothetical protein